jgi:DNA-binding winged helix-turn-helix (wHTH) protein
MTNSKLPFEALRKQLLERLADGHCVGIKGLSNSGKSLLMRALAEPSSAKEYKKTAGHEGNLVYIDCNRAVAISAQAFYEVVLRSILEALAESIPTAVLSNLREYHQTITEADTAFTASLSFNLALSELCEQIDGRLCLLIDEFGEIYAALDHRALLNLRALRDRFREHLAYACATWRSLPELRGDDVEDEFAELFSRFTYPMPLLTEEEASDFLVGLKSAPLDESLRKEAIRLSGGHPGMLVGVAQVLSHLPKEWKKQPSGFVRLEPQPRAECMKLWDQLDQDERAALIALVLDPKAGLPQHQNRHLHSLGLLRDNEIFSPIFADFVGRKGRGSEIDSTGVYLDSDSGDVWVDGVRVPVLTDLEYRLLELLYERRDKLTDKYQIVTAVWGEEYLGSVDDARVEKLISRLRGKIEPDPSNPSYLITRRGRGYKLLRDARQVKS